MGFSDSLYRSIFLIIMILISLKFYIKKVKQEMNSFCKCFLKRKQFSKSFQWKQRGPGIQRRHDKFLWKKRFFISEKFLAYSSRFKFQ